MAAHSGILAWRTPWTEEPGGLQSMGRKETQLKRLSTHVSCNHFQFQETTRSPADLSCVWEGRGPPGEEPWCHLSS